MQSKFIAQVIVLTTMSLDGTHEAFCGGGVVVVPLSLGGSTTGVFDTSIKANPAQLLNPFGSPAAKRAFMQDCGLFFKSAQDVEVLTTCPMPWIRVA
jgi:hypothetical protein